MKRFFILMLMTSSVAFPSFAGDKAQFIHNTAGYKKIEFSNTKHPKLREIVFKKYEEDFKKIAAVNSDRGDTVEGYRKEIGIGVVDLNADKAADFFAYVHVPGLCGARTCPLLAYLNKGKFYSEVLDISAAAEVYVFQSQANAYPSILLPSLTSSSSNKQKSYTQWKWNGKKYSCVNCK